MSVFVAELTMDREDMQYATSVAEGKHHDAHIKAGTRIATWTTRFSDGFQMDLNLVTAGDCGYLDPVLFDERGCEIATGDAEEEVRPGSEYCLFDATSGHEYRVIVVSA